MNQNFMNLQLTIWNMIKNTPITTKARTNSEMEEEHRSNAFQKIFFFFFNQTQNSIHWSHSFCRASTIKFLPKYFSFTTQYVPLSTCLRTEFRQVPRNSVRFGATVLFYNIANDRIRRPLMLALTTIQMCQFFSWAMEAIMKTNMGCT